MDKLDYLWGLVVQMGLVISIYGNFQLWMLQTPNIDTCRSSVLLQEVDKGGQIVCQVLGRIQSFKELNLVLFFVLFGLQLFVLFAILN